MTVVSQLAISAITDEARNSADGNETGGILLGTPESSGHTVLVRHAGRPGRHAIRRPDFFQRDLHHARSLADRVFEVDHSIWVGEWHTHLSVGPRPSTRDLTTYQELLADPEVDFDYFLALILADRSGKWTTPTMVGWVITPDQVREMAVLI